MAGSDLARARWWSIRPAQNRKPATYRCPLCGAYLPALSQHMLIVPEGDSTRRRHAHTDCVLAARKSGRLLTRDGWERSVGEHSPGLWQRLSGAVSRVAGRGR
jgi:hypothetical protein